MLMSFPELVDKHELHLRGVLHVGAHLAEEAELYNAVDDLDENHVWWVEANPAVLETIDRNLVRFPRQHLIHALVYNEDGVELDFNVTNYDGMSSSILEFGTHTSFSPDTFFVDKIKLTSRTIDSIVSQHGLAGRFNFLNMDLQGAELLALQGATGTLDFVDYVLTEVNKAEVYVGCAQVEQLDEHLHAFDRVETYWVGDQGWGDALYVRRQT